MLSFWKQRVACIVLEKIPSALAKKLSESIGIPTIGIGAGPDTDGQVLVVHDMLGITQEFKPIFSRQYADISSVMTEAVENYISDVKGRNFPSEKESY